MTNTLDHEPTLYDVMDLLVGMHGRFNSIDSRLNGIDSRFDLLEEKMNKGFVATHERIDSLEEHLVDLTDGVSKLSLQFSHLEETVDDHAEYIEDNSEKMLKHNSRIKKLEIKLAT